MSSGPRAGLVERSDAMGGTDLGASDERPRLALPASVGRGDVPALCDRARVLMEGRLGLALECDVAEVSHPDLEVVEALARVELTARRLGASIRLRGASVELLELLALCGLPIEVLEPEGQAEEREEAGGVEEEGDPGDPVT
jgi:ABC-type transporter Mla MlaB component